MKILAIDTSGKSQSIALSEGAQLVAETHLEELNSHTESLIVNIDQVLRQAQTTLAEVDLFVIVQGPGSFTGLRIGISTLKAFAHVTPKPIVAVSSLMALAFPFLSKNETVLSLLPAPFEQMFIGIFQLGENKIVEEIMSPQLCSTEKLQEIVDTYSHKKLICVTQPAEFSKVSEILKKFSLEIKAYAIQARELAKLGEQLYHQRKAISVEALLPLYLRPSEAERKFLEK